ncbi:MAG: glycosyltransferase [Candidatus Sericytochromatia bacterium]
MRILWGPFDHQDRDRWLVSGLGHNSARSFGPFGADVIYRPDQGGSLLPEIAAFAPDLILVLDPHLRLIGPDLLVAPCPLVACSGFYAFSAEQWGLFDGLLPVGWQAHATLHKHLPVSESLSDWRPAQDGLPEPQPCIYPLLCLGEHVSPALWQALEALPQPVAYLNSPHALIQQQLCAQSEVVLIPEHGPLNLALEAWAAGARLLVSEQIGAALQALLTPERDFVCFRVESLPADLRRAQALRPQAPAFAWQATLHQRLMARWPEIQTRSQQRQARPPQRALLRSLWAMAPVQIQALPLLQSATPHSLGKQLATARDLLAAGEPRAAEAQLRPLLTQAAPADDEAFPLPPQADRYLTREALWKGAVLSAWLESQPSDYDPLLAEAHPPWPLQAPLTTWLSTRHEAPALAKWLLTHWPAHVGLRSKAVALLPEAAQETAAKAAFFLCQQQAEGHTRRQGLEEMLSAAPTEPAGAGLVFWEGSFASYTSFARVNVGLQKGLKGKGDLDSLICELGRPEIATLMPPLQLPQPWRRPDILVSHTIPHRETAPAWGGKWVAIMPWEYGLAPRHSAACVAAEMDEAWLPSQYAVEAYQRSGVPAHQLQLIPNGVDTQVYCPEGPLYPVPTRKGFRILFVGGTLQRKGFDILLEAYLQAFGPDDDVCLVVKDYGGRGQYAKGQGLRALRKAMANPQHPEIVVLADDHLIDAELSSLYRACQLSVHPYRGEGFCMPLLEAMACGVPVVTPDAGPAPEFCPPAASWRIPTAAHFMARHTLLQAESVQNHTQWPSFYFEPQQAALSALLRQIVADPAACQTKGQAARQAALAYDWVRIGERVQARLNALRQQPLNRRERRAEAATTHQQQHCLGAAEALPLAQRVTQLWPESGTYWLSLAQRQLELSQAAAAAQSLRQAFDQGLELADALALPLFAQRWQPARIWKDPRCDLPLPRESAWFKSVEDPRQADFCLSSQPQAAQTGRHIVYLNHPGGLPLQGIQVHEIWTAERAWAETLVQAAGLHNLPIFEVPTALDFSRFTPAILPQYLPTPHAGILCITRWRQGLWQDLLSALRHDTDRLPLVVTLVPLGVPPEQAQGELQAWLKQQTIPRLTLRLQAPVQKAAALRQLYHAHSCFVDTDSRASGHWHLLAQAMGIPCISAGQRSFLARPYSEICQQNAPEELAWRLQERLFHPKVVRDALSIREHLRIRHDQPVVADRVASRLGQLALLHTLEEPRP